VNVVSLSGNAADNTINGTYTIASVSGATITLSGASIPSKTNIKIAVTHPAGAGVTANVTFAQHATGDTITRTDGGVWGAGFVAHGHVTVSLAGPSSGTYEIKSVSGSVLTIVQSNAVVDGASVSNVNVDWSGASVYFAASV